MMSLAIPTTSQFVNDTDINFGVTPGTSRRSSCYEVDFRLAKRRKIEVSPRENDVLFFGNSKMTCGHPGNVAFVDTIKKCLKTYQAFGGDIQVAKFIVEGLTSRLPPVRFLHHNERTREWSALSRAEATIVTNHALMTTNKQQLDIENQQNELSGAQNCQKRLASHLDNVASSGIDATKKPDTSTPLSSASTTTSLRELLMKGFSPSDMPPFECHSFSQPEKDSPPCEQDTATPALEDDMISLPESDSSPCGVDEDPFLTEFDFENVFHVLDDEDDNEFFDLI